MFHPRLTILGISALAITAGLAHAQGTIVVLTPQSSYVDHCQGPCDCFFPSTVVAGKLLLTFHHADPLYEYYTATAINWRIAGHTISGSGMYQHGGEVALVQRLTMNTTIDGLPHQLESGIVPKNGVIFPNVRIGLEDVTHASACDYVVMYLDAVTTCSIADVAGPGGVPGPDRHLTVDDITYFLDRFFANDLSVADVAGLGGAPIPDGALTADDVVAFLAGFFGGC